MQNPTIRIVSAEQLVGRPVRAASEDDAGEVKYLLIRTGSRKIEFAAIDTGGIFDFGDASSVQTWHSFISNMMPGLIG